MKTSLLALVFMGGAAMACGSTNTEPVALPEMRAVSSKWGYVAEHVRPVYPVELRRAGETGRVSVAILFDEVGRVKAVTILDSDNAALSAAARDAVRQWKFVPARNATKGDLRRATVTFSFELSDAA